MRLFPSPIRPPSRDVPPERPGGDPASPPARQTAHMAGLIGMGTPWDVFMMRRGRGSWGSGCEPQDIDDPFVSRHQWGHGIARVPSHGLGFGWYNAVTRAHMAGLIGMGTPWDVFMMRRGRGAVVVSLKTSMIRSCPVNSGDMASLECRLMG